MNKAIRTFVILLLILTQVVFMFLNSINIISWQWYYILIPSYMIGILYIVIIPIIYIIWFIYIISCERKRGEAR